MATISAGGALAGESLALPYQSYAKAFTAAMLSGTLSGKISASEMANDGGYEDLDADGDY